METKATETGWSVVCLFFEWMMPLLKCHSCARSHLRRAGRATERLQHPAEPDDGDEGLVKVFSSHDTPSRQPVQRHVCL